MVEVVQAEVVDGTTPGRQGRPELGRPGGLAGRGDAVDTDAERAVPGMRGQQVVDHPVDDQAARLAHGKDPGHSNQTYSVGCPWFHLAVRSGSTSANPAAW